MTLKMGMSKMPPITSTMRPKLKFNQITAIGSVINKFIKETERERAKAMGGRFVVTGVQLGILKADLKLLEQKLGKAEEFDRIFKELEEIHEKQFIGDSETLLSEDVNDLCNLFASWISKPKTSDTETDKPIGQTVSDFTIYWRGGKREVVRGLDVADALTHAGYGHGALKALDFHMPGNNHDYKWDSGTREWIKKKKDLQ